MWGETAGCLKAILDTGHRPVAFEDSDVLLPCSLLVVLFCSLFAYIVKQSMLRIRREMNVERGRERNTDSEEGAEECSLQVQALAGNQKRSQS